MKIFFYSLFFLMTHSLIAQVNSDSTNIKNGQKIHYYKDGTVESILDTQNRYEKKFYPNGQLKMEKEWSRKNKIKLKEYFPNGILNKKQSHKKLEIYNQDKVIIERMNRKEILIFERLFRKKKHGREKFYTYQWESFDDRGIIKRKIIFNSDHFNMNPFPDSIQQIDDFLFEEIIFYFNGKEFKKMALEVERKKELSRKLVVYRKEEKKWVKEKTIAVRKVYELIDNYSN